MNGRRCRVAAVALLAIAAAGIALAGSGRALAATRLPDSFGAVVVDDAHHHVLVSSPAENSITVVDFSGAPVATIPDVSGAGSMVVDGSTLYVVAGSSGTVEAYDTGTYRRLAEYGAGVLVQPRPLALAGGKLWTSTGKCGGLETKLVSIDLTAPHAVHVYDPPGRLVFCIGLAEAPHNLNQLLAWDDGEGPSTVFRFDVSTGIPVLAAQKAGPFGLIVQLAVTADGTRFASASGAPYEVDEFTMSDLDYDAIVYPTGPYPNAVATTGGRGGLLAAGIGNAVQVYELGNPDLPVFTSCFCDADNTLRTRGLAMSADGRFLFAVSGAVYTGPLFFNVFDLTAPPPASSTTTAPPPVSTTPTTANHPNPGPASASATGGYWALGSDGHVFDFGQAAVLGNGAAGAVDIEPTPTRKGYWILNRSGAVQPFGDAVKLGDVDAAGLSNGETPASLSATPTGRGYWVFTNRGRALPFGDAPFLGDMGAQTLNGPVLGSVATPSGRGYYMVASDGGIFAFGDAAFAGSMGARKLNAPVQGLVPDGDGHGYWLVASDGGIFAFDAPFRGSMGATLLNKPISGMVRYGDGYLMVGADGGIFNFSDQPFAGSLGANPPVRPIVSVAAAG